MNRRKFLEVSAAGVALSTLGGYAAEFVTADGTAKFNGGDASLSGLLAWCAWYAVHALGERP